MIVKVCVAFAGLMSGLTVGYLSIDKLDLEIKQAIGTPQEKRAVSPYICLFVVYSGERTFADS